MTENATVSHSHTHALEATGLKKHYGPRNVVKGVSLAVKSGEVVHSASLKYYAKKHADSTPLRVRFSQRNLTLNNGVLNLPLYMVDRGVEFITKAMQETER